MYGRVMDGCMVVGSCGKGCRMAGMVFWECRMVWKMAARISDLNGGLCVLRQGFKHVFIGPKNPSKSD